jgi:CPA2 family monovalent cation:H+ antiporter-2
VAAQLAEIGVVLLMFGVGLHFSLRDLWAVRAIALPGAIGQITVATALGAFVIHVLDWSWSEGVIIPSAVALHRSTFRTRSMQDRPFENRFHRRPCL